MPGTLNPGLHFVVPLVEDVALFDTRDQVFTTGVSEDGKNAAASVSSKSPLLDTQAKAGLTLGLAITVRYRLDPKRPDYIQGNLPRPVEKEIVPPIVDSVWRELVPNYTVRDVFLGQSGRSPAEDGGQDHAEAGGRRNRGETE